SFLCGVMQNQLFKNAHTLLNVKHYLKIKEFIIKKITCIIQKEPMNIHFVNDEKFINKNVKDFEYFYPNKNLFFVKDVFYKKEGHTKYVDINNKNVFLWEYGSSSVFDKIVSKANKIEAVFVHCLDTEKAFWAMQLKE